MLAPTFLSLSPELVSARLQARQRRRRRATRRLQQAAQDPVSVSADNLQESGLPRYTFSSRNQWPTGQRPVVHTNCTVANREPPARYTDRARTTGTIDAGQKLIDGGKLVQRPRSRIAQQLLGALGSSCGHRGRDGFLLSTSRSLL